jgi:hypothetical protein
LHFNLLLIYQQNISEKLLLKEKEIQRIEKGRQVNQQKKEKLLKQQKKTASSSSVYKSSVPSSSSEIPEESTISAVEESSEPRQASTSLEFKGRHILLDKETMDLFQDAEKYVEQIFRTILYLIYIKFYRLDSLPPLTQPPPTKTKRHPKKSTLKQSSAASSIRQSRFGITPVSLAPSAHSTAALLLAKRQRRVAEAASRFSGRRMGKPSRVPRMSGMYFTFSLVWWTCIDFVNFVLYDWFGFDDDGVLQYLMGLWTRLYVLFVAVAGLGRAREGARAVFSSKS